METRVYVADPRSLRRAGVLNCLAGAADLVCVGETAKGSDVCAAAQHSRARVLILSDELVQAEGNDLLERLATGDAPPAVLLLAAEAKTAEVERYLQRGASGLLTEAEADRESLVSAVRRVAAGEIALSPRFFSEILAGRRHAKRPASSPMRLLTARELEVFRLTGSGLEAKEIADRLSLSPRTVDVHRANIRKKLGIRGVHELMRFAMHWAEDQRQTDLLLRFSQEKGPLLLVEDDEVDILSVQRALRELRAGLALAVARTGEEALAYLRSPRNFRPSLVLVDIKMPRMSGHELLAEMRKDPALATLPVVALTSSRQDEDKTRMYQFGLAGYLVKPATSVEFLEMFRTLAQYWAMSETAPVAVPAGV